MWELEAAQGSVAEIVQKAATEGPQVIARQGEAVAVVIAFEEFVRLRAAAGDFVGHLLNGPSFEALELTRDRQLAREIVL